MSFSHYLAVLSSYLPSRTPKQPMQPLFAVHNNVSLLSVHIAPSTFLALFIVGLVFLALYIPKLPSFSGLFGLFRRRTPDTNNTDKDIVLQGGRRFVRNPQNPDLFVEDYYGSGGTSPYRDYQGYQGHQDYQQDPFYNRQSGVPIDWRHRQLPPLPPPPFRPLIGNRDDAEDSYDESYFKKRKSSRSDDSRREKERKREKEREKEREREKEKEREKKRQKDKPRRTSPFKRKHSSSATATATATVATTTELVRRSRREHVDVYDSPRDRKSVV